MNRTDRLLAIILELQARRYTRAEDLSKHFEVSLRTIYRDVFALCEAGVPVVSTPGYGYALAPGYFLPPVMLTTDEAGALLLGAAFVAEQVDAPYRQAVETARKKIEKLLPEPTRREVDSLQDSLRFVGRFRPQDPKTSAWLAPVRRAIQEREVLHLSYHARYGELGERDVEPHGLVCVDGRWLMGAYCRSRKAMRGFRLDRIDRLAPTGEHFTRREGFSVRYVPPFEYGPVEVKALFSGEALRWAREDLHFSFAREELHAEGVVLVFRPRDIQQLVSWLLSWGPEVRVLSPPEAQRQLSEAAQAVANLYPAEEPIALKQ